MAIDRETFVLNVFVLRLVNASVIQQHDDLHRKETSHSDELCRDFAEGLFLEFYGNVMQDFQLVTAMRSSLEEFLKTFTERFTVKRTGSVLYVGRPGRGAARTSCLLSPSSSSAIYNSYCVMAADVFGEPPFSRINGRKSELMLLRLTEAEVRSGRKGVGEQPDNRI